MVVCLEMEMGIEEEFRSIVSFLFHEAFFFKNCTAAEIVWVLWDCQTTIQLCEEFFWGGFYCFQLENPSQPTHPPTHQHKATCPPRPAPPLCPGVIRMQGCTRSGQGHTPTARSAGEGRLCYGSMSLHGGSIFFLFLAGSALDFLNVPKKNVESHFSVVFLF